MSHKPFYFKQFKIEQDQCAMKIGTDGVLLGAWAKTENANTILDIGTGTGVIAIMQAQRNSIAKITAIEIDKSASKQAQENFNNCQWKERLNLINTSLQDFTASTTTKFDHIISNPPFYPSEQFTKTLGSKERIIARNSEKLSYSDLMSCAKILLQPKGYLSIVIPVSVEQQVIASANQNQLNLIRKTIVYPTANKKPIRVLAVFSHQNIALKEDTLVIQAGGRNEFTEEYIALTKDFYTIL